MEDNVTISSVVAYGSIVQSVGAVVENTLVPLRKLHRAWAQVNALGEKSETAHLSYAGWRAAAAAAAAAVNGWTDPGSLNNVHAHCASASEMVLGLTSFHGTVAPVYKSIVELEEVRSRAETMHIVYAGWREDVAAVVAELGTTQPLRASQAGRPRLLLDSTSVLRSLHVKLSDLGRLFDEVERLAKVPARSDIGGKWMAGANSTLSELRSVPVRTNSSANYRESWIERLGRTLELHKLVTRIEAALAREETGAPFFGQWRKRVEDLLSTEIEQWSIGALEGLITKHEQLTATVRDTVPGLKQRVASLTISGTEYVSKLSSFVRDPRIGGEGLAAVISGAVVFGFIGSPILWSVWGRGGVVSALENLGISLGNDEALLLVLTITTTVLAAVILGLGKLRMRIEARRGWSGLVGEARAWSDKLEPLLDRCKEFGVPHEESSALLAEVRKAMSK